MASLLGLFLGTGLFLIWWSCWVPEPAPVHSQDGGPGTAGIAAARPSGLRADLEDLVLRAGASTAAQGLAVLAVTTVLTASVGFVALLAFSRSLPVACCFALLGAGLPLVTARRRARARQERWRELWPDVVDNLASAVRAGLSLPEALTQLGDRGPEPLRPAFVAFGHDYQVSARFGESLDALKERLADPVGDRICEALRITREVGGSDLGLLLRNLSGFLRQDAATRAELLARQSWTVYAARLAVTAPWLVLALLAGRPETRAAYARPEGGVVLLVGALASVLAYALMLRLGRLPDETRVLR